MYVAVYESIGTIDTKFLPCAFYRVLVERGIGSAVYIIEHRRIDTLCYGCSADRIVIIQRCIGEAETIHIALNLKVAQLTVIEPFKHLYIGFIRCGELRADEFHLHIDEVVKLRLRQLRIGACRAGQGYRFRFVGILTDTPFKLEAVEDKTSLRVLALIRHIQAYQVHFGYLYTLEFYKLVRGGFNIVFVVCEELIVLCAYVHFL